MSDIEKFTINYTVFNMDIYNYGGSELAKPLLLRFGNISHSIELIGGKVIINALAEFTGIFHKNLRHNVKRCKTQ